MFGQILIAIGLGLSFISLVNMKKYETCNVYLLFKKYKLTNDKEKRYFLILELINILFIIFMSISLYYDFILAFLLLSTGLLFINELSTNSHRIKNNQ